MTGCVILIGGIVKIKVRHACYDGEDSRQAFKRVRKAQEAENELLRQN